MLVWGAVNRALGLLNHRVSFLVFFFSLQVYLLFYWCLILSDSPLLDVAGLVDLVSEVSGADQASAVSWLRGVPRTPRAQVKLWEEAKGLDTRSDAAGRGLPTFPGSFDPGCAKSAVPVGQAVGRVTDSPGES